MRRAAIKPGTLQGANADDEYLAVVQHLVVGDDKQLTSGDTTDANAQLKALAHFGVSARLVQNADFQLIEQQIARGIPVPCLQHQPPHLPLQLPPGR